MSLETYVDTLGPGDIFRDWLVEVIGDRAHDLRGKVRVYKITPSSHNVFRYEFERCSYSAVAKFYAEPTGQLRDYNPVQSLEREYMMLQRAEKIIDIPPLLGMRRRFNCVLLTEYVRGEPLYKYIKKEKRLFDRLTAVAHTLRRLHDQTRTDYRKEYEFIHFHRLLDQLNLDRSRREMYNYLLGDWWRSSLLDVDRGCMIHNDANPVNYLFNSDKLYALDFESAWDHAHPVHDLGIVTAELKNYFGWKKGDPSRAEPYIGHFLWQYSRTEDDFHRITRALPFFMSLGLLRMARLRLGREHKSYIFRESAACLNSVGRLN